MIDSSNFDYDRWYSLNTLSEVFGCEWYDLPEKSNGVIISKQKYEFRLDMEAQAEEKMGVFVITTDSGIFLNTNRGTNLSCEGFKVIKNRPIFRMKGLE